MNHEIDGQRSAQSFPLDYIWAPGTVALKDGDSAKINLFPVPTSDPNDPLNWSTLRKTLNFGIVGSYILWTFVQLDVGYSAWGPMIDQLGTTDALLNAAAAANYAGLAVGCIFLMPFVHKFGRRPLYLFSSAVQLAGCIWQAKVRTNADIVGASIVTGLGGAICETIVQITIADIFFVHQHATMNSWYVLLTSIGAFLGQVASGYVADGQGWRWMWWWCTIFLSLQLLVSIFFYEESKFVPAPHSSVVSAHVHYTADPTRKGTTAIQESIESGEPHNDTTFHINPNVKPNSYLQRMALYTKTDSPLLRHVYQPFIILCTFPAVAYTAITVGCILSCFAIVTTVSAIYLVDEPYNFGPDGIGLMNLPPFIGSFLGFFVGGYLNDKSIMWLSKRNRGIFEPEQRLWMAVPASIFIPIGMLVFGIGIAEGAPWIILAVGLVFYGFGFSVCLDIALAYCTDCYQDIVADALVGVVFVRNVIAVVILFVLQAWLDGMGVKNVHILSACLMFVILGIPLILLKFGKGWRLWTHDRYKRMATKQPTFRTF